MGHLIRSRNRSAAIIWIEAAFATIYQTVLNQKDAEKEDAVSLESPPSESPQYLYHPAGTRCFSIPGPSTQTSNPSSPP